jgi:sulfite exporter TauE/SafE
MQFCGSVPPQEGSFKTLYKMKFYIISSGNLCVGICSSMRYGVGVILVVMAVGVVTK